MTANSASSELMESRSAQARAGKLNGRVAWALFAALTLVFGAPVVAQDVDEEAEEIVTIGTRTKGRVAIDSPVPVDVLNEAAMIHTGETEVGRMIQNLAPSFNFSSSSISDGTDALRPATLRGLGPDQTLVLINGKRRHGSALIHVNTSVGRGTAGTDLNAIPASAIKRIEILRDGAAAQYGSDAIAGVINIVLKDSADVGRVATSFGQYGENDGDTWVGSINKGFAVGDGFLNLGLEYRDRRRTNRAGLAGTCQYDDIHLDPLKPLDWAGDPTAEDTCTDAVSGIRTTTDARETGFARKSFRIGDSNSEQLSLMANFGLPVLESNELYGFMTYSLRENVSGGFYRRANQGERDPSLFFDGISTTGPVPINADGSAFFRNGFLPLIKTDVDDISANFGIRGWTDSGLNWDLSAGYGKNEFAFTVKNSINASLVSATGTSPLTAFAGELSLELFTADFDVFQEFDWGVIAGGVSFRRDVYELNPGDEVSYKDYDNFIDDLPGSPQALAQAATMAGGDKGINASGGIQVFPGFSPENQVDESRDSIAVYLDGEFNPFDQLMIGLAGRFEDYSDFGSTINGKITAVLSPVDMVKIRGAFSTGFRAPSLQQQFFNNTSTQFVSPPGGGPLVAEQRGTFRNDSQVAQAIGIPSLEEETSLNGSVGITLLPLDGLTISVDYYHIKIDDRIAISGSIGTGLSTALDAALAAAGASSAQFFLNAADTTTQGVDIVSSYQMDLMDGVLNFSLAFNYTKTKIDSVNEGPGLLPPIQGLVFTSQDQSILEEWQPKTRVNATVAYERGPLGVTVSMNHYGEYTVQEGNGDRQKFGDKQLFDMQVRYSFLDGFTVRAGGKNIFDVTPDKNNIGQSRGGTIVDGSGATVVSSPGVFQFSRRSAPFGFNGASWYLGVDYVF